MKRYELRNDNGKDITFVGEMIAEVDSRDFRRAPGEASRWSVLRIYQTKGGSFICESTGMTNVRGERQRTTVHVAENEDEACGMFKESYLSKALFDEAGFSEKAKEIK